MDNYDRITKRKKPIKRKRHPSRPWDVAPDSDLALYIKRKGIRL